MDLNGIAKAVKQSTMVLRVSSMIIRGYLLFVFPACQRWLRAQRALSYSVTELKYNHVTEFLFPRFFVVFFLRQPARLCLKWPGGRRALRRFRRPNGLFAANFLLPYGIRLRRDAFSSVPPSFPPHFSFSFFCCCCCCCGTSFSSSRVCGSCCSSHLPVSQIVLFWTFFFAVGIPTPLTRWIETRALKIFKTDTCMRWPAIDDTPSAGSHNGGTMRRSARNE